MTDVKYVASSKLPTKYGTFNIHGFLSKHDKVEHVAFTMGDFNPDEAVLTRIHSECLTGDAFFSLRCDCGEQLKTAMQQIAHEGKGLILYLRQEGRGIGLINKIKAYHLQDCGADTVEANEQLGFSADQRNYEMCAYMLKRFNITKVRLMTNNPEKLKSLEKFGISVVERISLIAEVNNYNAKYLETKNQKMGHLLKNHKKKTKIVSVVV